MSAPQQDWVSSRFGADPPLSLGSLRGDAAKLAPVRFDFSGLWAHDLAGAVALPSRRWCKAVWSCVRPS